jgi:hypothetical protein
MLVYLVTGIGIEEGVPWFGWSRTKSGRSWFKQNSARQLALF